MVEQAISKHKVSSNAISPPCEAETQTVQAMVIVVRIRLRVRIFDSPTHF